MQSWEPKPEGAQTPKNQVHATSNPEVGVTAAGSPAEASHLESVVEQANEKVKNYKPDEDGKAVSEFKKQEG